VAHQCWRTICQASSASYDFVYRTVQADWERIRANREYNDYRAHLACFPFNFTPEQTKLFDRMLRYKTPPNAASSALRLLHQRLTAKPPHIPDAVSSTPPLRYNEDTFAGLSPHRPPCQKPPT
jgi:hypothetical protein